MTDAPPFTAAQARALTDTRVDENRVMRIMRTDVFPALRSAADRGYSETTLLVGMSEGDRAAVQVHLNGLGYTVSRPDSRPREMVVSW